MNFKKAYLLFTAVVLTFFSCRKDKPPVLPQQGNISVSTTKRLLICNEGNYGQNNGSLSVYDPLSNAVLISAFSASNPNYTLGDVVQSINKFKGNYYVVVNNSGKIVVCNSNFARLGTIDSLISPRYIEFVSNDKAYVSNLQLDSTRPNYIQVIDLNARRLVSKIRVDGWSEEMATSYGNVYVTNQSKKKIYVINTEHDAVTDSIDVGATSAGIVKDENEKLWVSCNAKSAQNLSPRLVRINPVNNSKEADITLNSTQNSISRLCINGSGNTLYFLMNDVFKMDIGSTSPINIIQQNAHTFYGLCIDPNDETVYVSDAGNYNSNGTLLRYNSTYGAIGTYTVGVIPGYMLMD